MKALACLPFPTSRPATVAARAMRTGSSIRPSAGALFRAITAGLPEKSQVLASKASAGPPAVPFPLANRSDFCFNRDGVERLSEVCNEILHILDTNGIANQTVAETGGLTVLR